ncbi:MAG TPA: PEGA domain-containing protein [Bryobacteraceae bacterium]|nr:PEGA domain-containing protein [Bryobacteraceae bacterium]
MKKYLASILLCAVTSASAQQIVIPDGTKVRVQLDQNISSATADEGQTVQLVTVDKVKVGDVVVVEEGARVTGTVVMAKERGRMGKSGKLDFSIDRVRAVDGEWVPVRYEAIKKAGQSHAVSTGVLTAGLAVVFWPAAPFMLLRKGKDTSINKGVQFDVFTDRNHTLANLGTPVPRVAPNGAVQMTSTANGQAGGTASVTVEANVGAAEIEVDGMFVGNTPTRLNLAPGVHQVAVKANGRVWQRTIQVNAGSNVTINATFAKNQVAGRSN